VTVTSVEIFAAHIHCRGVRDTRHVGRIAP